MPSFSSEPSLSSSYSTRSDGEHKHKIAMIPTECIYLSSNEYDDEASEEEIMLGLTDDIIKEPSNKHSGSIVCLSYCNNCGDAIRQYSLVPCSHAPRLCEDCSNAYNDEDDSQDGSSLSRSKEATISLQCPICTQQSKSSCHQVLRLVITS